MESKKKYWLIKTGFASLALPLLVMGINYFMDPLWCFNISNKYNQFQIEINERKQKTNYITYRDFNYRGLLIGASRSAAISQELFKGLPVYNYSLNDLNVFEIAPFISYAKSRNGRPFDYIFLSLDFEKAGVGAAYIRTVTPPEEYIEESTSLFHRIKTLLSIDTLKYSLQNFKNYRHASWRYYDRNNVQHIRKFTKNELMGIFNLHLASYVDKKKSRYIRFKYMEDYKEYLRTIREENKQSIITPFIPPSSLPVLELIVRYGLLDDYVRWISDIVDVFGEVYVFMYPNEITEDYFSNFFDPIHAYPEVGDRIVDAIFNNRLKEDTEFGMYINRSNFSAKSARLKKMMKGVSDVNFRRFMD